MTYNAAYFIAKFEAIPEEKWCSGYYSEDDKMCALGHCGAENHASERPEYFALKALARKIGPDSAITVNDGYSETYDQPTPKGRILAWLRDAQEDGL